MSQDIRTLQSLAWHDPLAWMERMSGIAWKEVVRDENTIFQKEVRKAGGVSPLQISQFEKSSREHKVKDIFKVGNILVTPNGTSSYLWRWNDSSEEKEAAVVFSRDDIAWAVESDTAGKELYTLVCYKRGKKTPIWKYTPGIGPFLIIKDDYCYCIEAESELRYATVISIRADTGTGRRVYYKEQNPRYNCRLISGENRCLFVLSENSGRHKLFVIEDFRLKPLHPSSDCFFPVGYGSESEEACYFCKRGDRWEAVGAALQALSVPPACLKDSSFVFCSIASQLLITSSKGVLTLFELRHSVKPKSLYKIIGNLLFQEQLIFEGGAAISFVATVPGAYPVFFHRPGFGKLAMTPIESYASCSTGLTSKGVPYVLVLPMNTKPRNLMTIVYGGYGLPTKLNTTRWKPYLDCGWALVYALVRGGGDRDEAWAEDGRTYKKYNSIYDTEDVIQSVQKLLKISWKNTCVYGRSAGGYNVGSIVARHGTGGLIGAAYTEVPYVDILRTTTNDRLPLTILEYDEFGNPVSNIEDFSTIVRFSPVDSLPKEGAPGIFVINHTSLNDREVLPYESVKWITRLRGYPTPVKDSLPKLLSITENAGHFIRGSTATRQMAEDFVLLNSFFQVDCTKKSQ